MEILDIYVDEKPTEQNIINIFQGEWTSKLPEKYNINTQPGTALLFEDPRINWAEEVFGSFENLNILELGPLEGGHSYMFQNKKAKKIISIEANSRAYLKCLCIKEILNLNKVDFFLGNFLPYLKECTNHFDLVFASGVLYHMKEPIELIKMISKISQKVFIWTHYYDEKIISQRIDHGKKFGPIITFNYDGASYEGYTHYYNDALEWNGFCGGMNPDCVWLTRDSIIRALRNFGYENVKIGFDDPNHINGPALAICAWK